MVARNCSGQSVAQKRRASRYTRGSLAVLHWLSSHTKRILKSDHGGSIETPAPPGRVGVVLVKPDSGGLIILDWEWRQEDLDRPGFPEKWNIDFGGIRWQRT